MQKYNFFQYSFKAESVVNAKKSFASDLFKQLYKKELFYQFLFY